MDRRETIETVSAKILDTIGEARLTPTERLQALGLALRDLIHGRTDQLRLMDFVNRKSK